MIIRQAEIQKFGKLEKEQYRFSPQINIIYGPNESGKSTLMQFLKAMMYGLEKSRVRKTLDTYKKYVDPGQISAWTAVPGLTAGILILSFVCIHFIRKLPFGKYIS